MQTRLRSIPWTKLSRTREFGSILIPAMLLALSVVALGSGEAAQATNQQAGFASQTASFGPVVPGGSGVPASVTVLFSLPISRSTGELGYRVTAISSFAFTPSMPAAGGKSVTAADLLVGVSDVYSSLGGGSNAAIAAGFNYDPSAIRVAGGTSAATGRPTLADLLPGREILRAAKSTGAIPASGGTLNVSVRLAVPNQFFTPGSFSGTISLIVSQ
jgi:hypothetical protein